MHRDFIREAEIEEDAVCEHRGDPAAVADPDVCGDEEEPLPDTVPEPTQRLPLLREHDHGVVI